MLRKWFAKRNVEVAETTPQDDVDLVFNTQSDFEDVEMSRVDTLGSIEGQLDFSEYEVTEPEKDNKVTLHSSPLENKPVSVLGPALAALLPLGAFIGLLYMPTYDHNHMLMHLHFNVVSIVAFLAAGVAFIVGLAGNKLRNIQVTLVAMAFISLGMMFGLHGLTTPGILLEKNQVVDMTAPLSVLLTIVWLYLSSLSADHLLIRRLSNIHSYLIPAWTGLMGVLAGLLFYQPQLAEMLPLHSNPFRFLVALVTLELTIMTAWNYWQSYCYTRSPLQLAIVYSSAWLAISTIIMSTGKAWDTSWWLYHGLLLSAVVVMMVGLVLQYNRGRNLALALIGKGHKDPVERLEAAISPGVRRLIERTEKHDAYTAGHNHRVAVIAVQIGEQMGLSSGELRALAQGGIVHDLGKLQIPCEILNKPGKLESDERALIETHPTQGYELAKRLGFMPQELDIIRYHHERWDGAGYPDKLVGKEIPLLARITAIADVYDALTSERAYRQPWSHEQTRTHILGQAGFQFDPQCVQAWDQLNQRVAEEDEVSLMTATIGAVA